MSAASRYGGGNHQGPSPYTSSYDSKPRISSAYNDSSDRFEDEDGFGKREEQGLNVNVNKPQQKSRSLGSPVMGAALTLACLGATGFGVFGAVNAAQKIPPLNRDKEELEEQVNRLEAQVNLLEMENERFTSNNDQFNSSIHFFRDENVRLNETSIRMRQSIEELEAQLPILQQTTADLDVLVTDLRAQVDTLNGTVFPLQQHVDQLNATVTTLIQDGTVLQGLKTNLDGNITDFTVQNNALAASQTSLQNLHGELNGQSNILNGELNALQSLTERLGAANDALSEEVRQRAAQLSLQVQQERQLGMNKLALPAFDALTFWECSLGDLFPDLVNNPDAPIGPTGQIDDVMTQVEFSVVVPLCLDANDLRQFLNREYQVDTEMTLRELLTGVDIYGTAALRHYFPPPGSPPGGLTAEDWEDANFDCNGVPKYEHPTP